MSNREIRAYLKQRLTPLSFAFPFLPLPSIRLSSLVEPKHLNFEKSILVSFRIPFSAPPSSCSHPLLRLLLKQKRKRKKTCMSSSSDITTSNKSSPNYSLLPHLLLPPLLPPVPHLPRFFTPSGPLLNVPLPKKKRKKLENQHHKKVKKGEDEKKK